MIDQYECEGQMTISDLGIWCGKMSPEPSVQTEEKTSELCWKKWQGSAKQESLFLDLRKGSGQTPESLSVMGSQLRGEFLTHNIGESLNEGSGYALSQILMGIQHPKSYSTRLNTTDAPSEEISSHLSEILETNPDSKYNLSERACQGILNRALKRGKELPEMLRIALEQVAYPTQCKSAADAQGGGKGALIQEDKSATLSTSNIQTLFQPIIALEGKGQRPTHTGCGYNDTGKSYTINSSEVHCVVYKGNCDPGGDTAFAIVGDHENRPTDMTNIVVSECYRKTSHPRNAEEGQGWEVASVSDTLNVFDNTEARTPNVVVSASHGNFFMNATENVANTLVASDYKDPTIVCYWDGGQVAGTLTASNADGRQRMPDKDNCNLIISGEAEDKKYIVRRLTPLECERLQGYPDGWTDIESFADSMVSAERSQTRTDTRPLAIQ